MDTIFHEKQEGQLCAQHCLNTLLQGPYYTAVDLATIAGHLDEEERRRMAGGTAGENSEEYRRFIAQPSANMDDTGFFSVQVIANAIGVWGLEIISYNSSDTRSNSARGNPTSQSAFICNYREHWFTIRRLGNQWFNLNSLLTGPELISDTYLSLFLTQLQTEGYTIYVVCGNLPECTANQMLNLIPAVQSVPPRLINEGLEGNLIDRGRVGAASSSLSNSDATERGAPSRPLPGGSQTSASETSLIADQELERAMAMSLADSGATGHRSEEDDFQLAMQLSKSMMEKATSSTSLPKPSEAHNLVDQSNIVSEEDELQRAIAMSLEAEAHAIEQKSSIIASSASSSSHAENKTEAITKSDKSPVSVSLAENKSKQTQKASGNPGWPSKAENPITQTKDMSFSKKDKELPVKKSETNPSEVKDIQQTKTTGKTPATSQGPETMPGAGQSLGGSRLCTDHDPAPQISSQRGSNPSDPDPEEVRRRRLAFLEKQNKKN